MSDGMENIRDQAREANSAVRNFNNALDAFTNLGNRSSQAAGDVSTAFEDLKTAAEGIEGMFSGIVGATGNVTENIPLVGSAIKGFTESLSITAKIGRMAFTGAIEGAKAFVNILDQPSRGIRQLDKEMFDLTKQFGGTIDEASRFADSLKTETGSQFSRSLYITRGQMEDFMQATANTSLTFDQLNQSIDTALGTTTLYNVALAASRAMGIDVRTGAALLDTAINSQGMTAEEAAGSFGMFAAVSEKVGLRSSTVAKTLNDAVSGFTKLGLQAEFGRPVLEGFGRVMDDMGLGIENATGLTTNLTQALANLTTNYGNAYLMFQRGGLDIGGGGGQGVLGASIGLQAAMLDPNTDQAALGAELMGGMRDTIASFAGGEIITVGEAAEDPGLSSQFFVQQQMLKNQFGIRDEQSANRVLELLQKFGEAQRTGNVDAQRSLSEQLEREQQGVDKTLDEWEKANRNLEIQSNLLAVVARGAVENLREQGAAPLRDEIDKLVDRAGGEKGVRGAVRSSGMEMSEGITDQVDEIMRFALGPGYGDRAAARSNNPNAQPGQTPQQAANVVGNRRTPPVLAQQGMSDFAEEVNTTSMRDINNLGYETRGEFEQALAKALAQAVAGVTVNVNLTESAREFVQASSSVNTQFGQQSSPTR